MNDQHEPATTESWVDLPATVGNEFVVYLNGILQRPEIDYRLEGRTLVFPRPLIPEVKMSKLQWVLVLAGVTGSYRKHDSVDVAYRHASRNVVATGLEPRAPDSPPG